MISVHSCVRGRISVHLPEEWQFAMLSCVRGKIPVLLLEGWWFRCIHVWGVRYRCIYLRSVDFGAILPLTHECMANCHSSGKSILPLTHECTEIIIAQVNAPESSCNDIPPLTHECTANRHPSGKCTDIPPLTHECTNIIIPQVNAPESYLSHMNAPQIVTPQVNAPTSYPSHMNAPKSSSLK